MGKVISFCSAMHGTSTTANIMAVAVSLVSDYNKSVLLMQTHFSMNNMEKPLIGDISKTNETLFYQNTGLDALIRLYKSGNLTESTVKNAVVNIGEDGKFAVLTGTKQTTKEVYDNERERSVIECVIRELKKYYDFVLIDTNAGFSSQTASAINQSDAVVFNLRQNKSEIKALFNNDVLAEVLNSGDKKRGKYYLFGSYVDESKYSLPNLCRMFSEIKKTNSGCIGLSATYMDAISDYNAYNVLLEISESCHDKKITQDSWWKDVEDFTGLLV